MMLEAPTVLLEVEERPSFILETPPTLEDRTRIEITSAVERLLSQSASKVAIKVLTHAPEHMGFGSKTSLLLSCLVAARNLLNLAVGDEHLKAMSGRGGTSGIGTHGFFQGGCLTDFGHRRQANQVYLPSNAQESSAVVLQGFRLAMPSEWYAHLVVPEGLIRTREEEIAFFKASTPVPQVECLEAIAIAYHGILPAIAERDLTALEQSLEALHKIGFKKRELESQSLNVKSIYDQLVAMRLGPVGMSSLGPTLFVITEKATKLPKIESLLEKNKNILYFTSAFRNTGYATREF